MSFDITPIHYQGLNCFEDQIISIISWLEYQYEFMFSESWKFNFNPKFTTDNQTDILGKKIKSDELNKIELLNKYHGIKLINHFIEKLDELLFIINE